jgi:hypothetical protein
MFMYIIMHKPLKFYKNIGCLSPVRLSVMACPCFPVNRMAYSPVANKGIGNVFDPACNIFYIVALLSFILN